MDEAREETGRDPTPGDDPAPSRRPARAVAVWIAAAVVVAAGGIAFLMAGREAPPVGVVGVEIVEGAAAIGGPEGGPQSKDAQPVLDPASHPKGALAGEPAPEMSFPLFDGSTFVLSEHLSKDGRPLVLNFWASWCAPCRDEIPEFSEVAESNPDVAFVGVAVEDGWDPAKEFAAEVGASYPLGYDENGSVTDNYPFIGLPVTYLIDADGVIARQVHGQMTGPALQAFIDHDFGA